MSRKAFEKIAEGLEEALEVARRSKSQYVDDKAVKDFTRVCEQTGLIDKLRKE